MAVNLKIEQAPVELYLISKEAIKAGQDIIRVSLLNLDRSIHENAVQCMLHAEKHGDTSLMVRLLVDIIDSKTGYRRAGLINWMRKFSPMELSGKTINLSGTDGKGNKRPFLVAEANATPFWTDSDNAERVAKPVFKDTLLSKIDTAYNEFTKAIENTVNGKPVDPSKPFYDGIHSDKVADFFAAVKAMRDELPADETRAVRLAQAKQAELAEFVKANQDAVNVAA